MESQITLADELPGLYRSILEVVAPLERTADRARALRLRMEATEVYSQSWDERAQRRLGDLLRCLRRLEARHETVLPTTSGRRLGWHPLRRAAITR